MLIWEVLKSLCVKTCKQWGVSSSGLCFKTVITLWFILFYLPLIPNCRQYYNSASEAHSAHKERNNKQTIRRQRFGEPVSNVNDCTSLVSLRFNRYVLVLKIWRQERLLSSSLGIHAGLMYHSGYLMSPWCPFVLSSVSVCCRDKNHRQDGDGEALCSMTRCSSAGETKEVMWCW